MLLVERIVKVTDGGMICLGRIPADGPLAAGQSVASTFLGLELAAQTAAVLEALRRDPAADEKPRIGYLASIRTARFEVSELPTDQALRATIQAVGSAPPLAMYQATVQLESDGTPLLSATLSTYLTDQSTS